MKFVSGPVELLQSDREEVSDKPANNKSIISTSSSKSRGGKRAPKNQATGNRLLNVEKQLAQNRHRLQTIRMLNLNSGMQN